MLADFACDLDKLEQLWTKQIPAISNKFQGVVVAVSGGLDSIALFHLFLEFSKKKIKFNLAVCHTNFGLRGKESDDDQHFVKLIAEEAGVPCYLNQISTESKKNRLEKNTQKWARNERYQHFKELASKGWVVALAHHQDDVAENVLFRLARGTSPGSMAGMTAWSNPYWRPLIGLSRQQLSKWVDRHELRFRHDSSNDKMIYSRNLIRHKVIPLLEQIQPGASKRIARTALQAHELGSFCTNSFQGLIECAKTSDADIGELLANGRIIGKHILAQMIGPLNSGRKALEGRFLDTVWEALRSSEGGTSRLVICMPASRNSIEISGSRFRIMQDNFGRRDKRAVQHQASRSSYRASFCLPSQSRTKLELHSCFLIWKNLHEIPMYCFVQMPRSQQKLSFNGQRKVWSFKDLMLENNLSTVTLDRVFVISESKEKRLSETRACIALLLDLEFLVPDHFGILNRVSVQGLSARLQDVD